MSIALETDLDTAPLSAPDHLPPLCDAALATPSPCGDTFAQWSVTTRWRPTQPNLLCTPCKDRWTLHGSVATAVHL